MTKLLCPRCMKSLTIPDDFTGREVTCPSCNHSFEAPTRYTPTVLTDPVSPPAAATMAGGNSITSPIPATPIAPAARTTESSAMPLDAADRPPAPPGLVSPPITVGPASAAPAGSTDSLPGGYTRSHGFVISPRVVSWLPAILLTISFICAFFPWEGTSIGSNFVDSQGPWKAMFGAVNRDYKMEELMQLPSGWLDNVKSNWELLLPGLLCLVFALVFAWADHFDAYLTKRMTAKLATTWMWRHAIIGGLAAAAFFLLVVQFGYGFGIERAVRKVVTDRFAKEREAAAGSPSLLDTVKYHEQEEYAKFKLETSFWPYLCLTCLPLAAIFMLCRIALDQRGAKPPPRLVIQY